MDARQNTLSREQADTKKEEGLLCRGYDRVSEQGGTSGFFFFHFLNPKQQDTKEEGLHCCRG